MDQYGQALWRLGWGEPGYKLWAEFSATGTPYEAVTGNGKYKGLDDLEKTWRTFKPAVQGQDNITVGTIIKEARDVGWRYMPEANGGARPSGKDRPKQRANGRARPVSADAELSAEVELLARMPPLDYGRIRKDRAEQLGVGVKFLDDAVSRARGALVLDDEDAKPGQGQRLQLSDPEPWPEPVDGTELPDAMVDEIKSYVAMEYEARRCAMGCAYARVRGALLHTKA